MPILIGLNVIINFYRRLYFNQYFALKSHANVVVL